VTRSVGRDGAVEAPSDVLALGRAGRGTVDLVTFETKTADELTDPALEARWAARRAAPSGEVLRAVVRLFLERGGPVPLSALPEPAGPAVDDLDAQDLLLVRDGRIELAYPFATGPNAFAVVFPDGRERYACCAIDALGIAPMVGYAVRVRSRCHHCGEPLAFGADPRGPGPEAAGVMVWVGRRPATGGKVCTSL
jgi:alkylmercury lyase-like protein